MPKFRQKPKNGYVTLISILIISAVGVSIMVSMLLSGIGMTRSAIILEQSEKAKALANACAEEALQQIWRSDAYTGSGSLSFGDGNCSFSVSGATVPKTISASGNVGGVVRKVSVTIDQLHPYVSANPWQELP